MMQLSSLDAEFLDGMIASHDTIRQATTEYIRQSDETSNPMVVEAARGLLEQLNYADQMYKEMRGHADGDALRQQENEAAVEVTAAY
jgi:hypothetical protein